MTPPNPTTPNPLSLQERILALWRLKITLALGLTVLFCIPYIYIANHPHFPVHDVPLTWLDKAIPFDHRWIWVYQSVYLLTGILPLLAHTREQLRRFISGYALLVGVCFFIFIFFPTQIIRHHPAEENVNFMFQILWLYDGNYSALPSLHVGFLYFTLMFARRVYGPVPRWVSAVFITWFFLIAYSTLALKEHYAWDLITGVALAVICDMLAWSRMVRISPVTSQPG